MYILCSLIRTNCWMINSCFSLWSLQWFSQLMCSLRKNNHFATPPLVCSQNDVCEMSTEIPFSLMTCHYPDRSSASEWYCRGGGEEPASTNQNYFPDLGSNTLLWNFFTLSSDIISWGSQNVTCFLRLGWIKLVLSDHYMFLGNCPPTPPQPNILP